MSETAENKQCRATVKKRHVEIEQCLARHGLSRRPRPLLTGASPFSEDTHCRRLREALSSLGPVFSSFGIYLASRADLLPVSYCLELCALPDLAEATPIAVIRQVINRNVGSFPEDIFIRFEEEPFESRLLFQSHYAFHSATGPVIVKVIHPEVEEWIDTDLQVLPVLKDAFVGLELTELQIDSAITDFRHALEDQMDLILEARSLEALAQDAKEFELLRAPVVHKQLCSSKVLTAERLNGIRLDHIGSSFNGNSNEAAAFDLGNVASTLCLVWLRQGMMGSVLPVDPLTTNVMILPNQQIAFTGVSTAKPPSDSKANLWNYVTSVLADDTDKACECLLREMEENGQPINAEDLRHRFRQVIPFRDGGWSDSGRGDTLAEHMFVQWRLASAKGLRPQPHLIRFYRGLFLVAVAARRLTCTRDSLREGAENLRMIAAVAQFREMMGLRQLGESTDKYVAMMMELPKKLDDVLTLAAEGSALVKLQVDQTSGQRRTKNSLASATALTMLLVACALFWRQLAGSVVDTLWIDRIGAVAFVTIGALLIRIVSFRVRR